jgi:hypothetical protein
MELRDFLEEYKKALELLKEEEVKVDLSPKNIREGHVYRIPLKGKAPVWVLVVGFTGNNHLVEVVPLSFEWVLATRYDYILNFEHPLRDTWIAQLDLTAEAPLETFLVAEEEGRIAKEDLELIKKVLRDETSIPASKRGRGYEDEVHREFKKIEYERHRFLFEDFFSSLSDEGVGVVVPTPLRLLLEG